MAADRRASDIYRMPPAPELHPVVLRIVGNLRRIRKRVHRNQQLMAEAAGVEQPTISRWESGRSGWDALQEIVGAIERAGGDPFDLLATADDEVADPVVAEIRRLLPRASATTRAAVLLILRDAVAAREGLDRKAG